MNLNVDDQIINNNPEGPFHGLKGVITATFEDSRGHQGLYKGEAVATLKCGKGLAHVVGPENFFIPDLQP